MKNQVIEVLDKEHGKKVIKYFQSIGVDTRRLKGNVSAANSRVFRYYGVIDGKFANYSLCKVKDAGAEIITLPEEKAFPREMLVSDRNSISTAEQRVVIAHKCGVYISWKFAKTIAEAENATGTCAWKYAWELEEAPIYELTKQEIANRLGLPVDRLSIID